MSSMQIYRLKHIVLEIQFKQTRNTKAWCKAAENFVFYMTNSTKVHPVSDFMNISFVCLKKNETITDNWMSTDLLD